MENALFSSVAAYWMDVDPGADLALVRKLVCKAMELGFVAAVPGESVVFTHEDGHTLVIDVDWVVLKVGERGLNVSHGYFLGLDAKDIEAWA